MAEDLEHYRLQPNWLGNYTVYKEIPGTRPWGTSSRWVRCKSLKDWQDAFAALYKTAMKE